MVRFIDFKILVIFLIMWSTSFLDIYLKFDTYEDLSSRIYDKRASHGTLELANCIQIFFTTFVFHSGVQHILCCVFVLFFFAMLPVSLNCPFLISPSVFSNVYLISQGFLKNCRIISFKRFFPEFYKRCEHIVEKYSVTSVQMMRAGSNNDNNFIYYILSSNKGIFVRPIWPEVNCPYFHTPGK